MGTVGETGGKAWSGVREEKQSDELLFGANVAASEGRFHRASENYGSVNSAHL